MKLKYSIIALLAAAFSFVACEQEEPDHFLNEIKVSTSYVSFPAEGSTVTVDITTTDAWNFEKIIKSGEKDANDKDILVEAPAWLTISPLSGVAGDNKITITATAAEETREASLSIFCAGKSQIINVIQMTEKKEPEVTPIQDAIAQGTENGGGNFRLKGMITKVVNTQYGNFYIQDETGEMYIYGVKNAGGQYPKDADGGWDSFGIGAGDVVTLDGPFKLYNGTPEIVDALIVAVEKSLIDVEAFDFAKLPAIDTTFNLVINAKVSPLLVTSDSEWLQITGVSDKGAYVLHADANDYTAERTATITIKAPGALKTVAITQVGIPATGAKVTDIIAMADASEVETLESTTIAKTTKGVVIWDGTNAIYVYGDKAADVKVGDNIKVFGTKKTYNGVPEIELSKDNENHKVVIYSSGNAFEAPAATDITADAGTYTSDKAVYVKLTGTLKVSGNYLNLLLDEFPEGEHQGSIVNPVDDLNAKSYDGKKITITGWFNGLSGGGKYINVITTKIVEFVDNPKGTLRNPYGADELAAALLAGETIEGEVYARGIINKIDNVNLTYGNAQYWLSDDGQSPTLEVYRGFWYGGEKFTAEDQIAVGDEVLVYGKVKVYNNTPEFDANNKIITLNGKAAPAGDGTADNPYNVTKLAGMLLAGETIDGEVYAKGIISQIDNVNLNYGNAQYWISDDGSKLYQMEVYRGFWFGGAQFTDAEQIALGDEVVVYGKVKVYNNTPEFDANNKIISLNGATE